ncbi:hypothetical protein M436DRAFT_68443 [Aureobasidium namibiae CBS 147.97]|uniref:DUF4334 domain-containing protein n=1 Tax=Aureobasidium namibiae CBS 147.97 TaxID=1043004 RepID=A0A074WE05_9PEZI
MGKSVQDLLAAGKATSAEAAAAFETLGPVRPEAIVGRWKGSELATGHAVDGTLSASGWYGKEFTERDAHPLLFQNKNGEVFAGNPTKTMALGARGESIVENQKEVETKDYQARIRVVEHKGVSTASMLYNEHPIIDHFRKVDDNTLLGVMDNLLMPEPPFYFVLRRE